MRLGVDSPGGHHDCHSVNLGDQGPSLRLYHFEIYALSASRPILKILKGPIVQYEVLDNGPKRADGRCGLTWIPECSETMHLFDQDFRNHDPNEWRKGINSMYGLDRVSSSPPSDAYTTLPS